ncbi:MAG: hypothetical protein QM704_14510 [Anaeromyxobacteraceae bacterium]
MNLSALVRELRRRRVFSALAGYGIAAFAILQVVEPVKNGLHLPDWVLTAAVIGLGLGFPVAAALAWVFDITAKGIERTADSGAEEDEALARGPRVTLTVVAIGVLAALPGVALHFFVAARSARPAQDARSVAVLPFSNLSPSPEDAYFAEGVHSEIITQLARLSGLKVIARGSVQQYAPGARDLPAIAVALGVATVLEGTVQRVGNRVRIAAQLVNAATRRPLWAQSYDRDLADTFAIQTEVALDIAGTLGARITGAERQEVGKEPTADREAHDLYLRAVTFWERSMGVEEDNRTAEELLRKALARDPGFALAHAKLSQVLSEWKRDCPGARAEADRAAELAPGAPEAHAARGSFAYYCGRNTLAGVEAYAAAVRAAPGDAQLRTYLGFLRSDAGQVDDGLVELDHARALDPNSYAVGAYRALALASARRFTEAEGELRRVLALAPGDAFAGALSGLVPHWQGGDLEPAARALAAMPRQWPTMGDGARYLAEILVLLPERTLALAARGDLPDPVSETPFVSRAFVVALAHATLGQGDEARRAFEAARPALERRVRAEPEEPGPRVTLARCYAGLGWSADALRELGVARDLLRTQGLSGANLRIAMADAALAAGRSDLALDALREALAKRDGFVTPAALRADPRFAAVRGDIAP